MPWKAVKSKNNSKIRHADEIYIFTLNNQFKCLEQQQIDLTIAEANAAKNNNIETNTEKVGNKINIYQNKSKIPYRKYITEKLLQNDKHIEKGKKIVTGNKNYVDIAAFGWKKYSLLG